MEKTEIEKRFDYMVSKILWPDFKLLGYKKSGNNFRFYNKEEGWGKIVNFQKSIFYNKQHIHFTINISIFSEKVYKYIAQSPEDKFKEYNCTIRNRIGRLMNTVDTWYDLTPDTDFDKLYEDIDKVFKEYIHPYLNKFSSETDVFDNISKKVSLNIPQIKALFYNGYQKRALDGLEKEIKDERKVQSYLERMIELKQELKEENMN